jgi:ferredoxin
MDRWYREGKPRGIRNPSRYLAVVNKTYCNGCGLCVERCWFEAIARKRDMKGELKAVVNPKFCMGCGSCAAACPVRAITHEYGKPNVNREMCIKCGACYAQCPRSFFNFDVMNEFEGIMELIDGALK